MNANYQIFHHFEAILDNLLENSDFLKAYYQHPYSFEGQMYYDSGDVHIHSGITRHCIIDDTYDYVVKFDIEEDSWGGSVCKRETEIYHEAVAAGMDKYFASAVYVGTYERDFDFYDTEDIETEADVCCFECDEDSFDEIFKEVEGLLTHRVIHISLPLYAYQRACLDSSRSHGLMSDEQYEVIKSVRSPLTDRNKQVGFLFLDTYGIAEYKKFTRFAVKHHINDLHLGNIGFINDKICFIDYGGFHDSCDCSDEYEYEEDDYAS